MQSCGPFTLFIYMTYVYLDKHFFPFDESGSLDFITKKTMFWCVTAGQGD